MNNKVKEKIKMKLRIGDKVQVIAGSDKGKEGKIVSVNRETNRVLVQGVNMITKHVKAGKSKANQRGGILHQEAYIHASNVMYLQDGKPTRIGIEIQKQDKKSVKNRVAKSTGDIIKD